MKISELTEAQRSHLAWRLDHNTTVGYVTACRIANLKLGNPEVVDVFKKAGKSDRSSKLLAHKVENYIVPDTIKLNIEIEIKFEDVIKNGAPQELRKAVSDFLPMFSNILASQAEVWKQDAEQCA